MKNYKLISFFALILLLGACAVTPTQKTANSVEINNSELTKNLQSLRQSADYILQPGDLVDIQVFMEEDMTRTLRIATKGTITYPLVGNIKIAGYSLTKAEERLSNALKTYIKNPQVSMLIQEYANKTVYVLGQVKKPAAIQIPPEKPLTVLEAITSVGGFTDIAATSKVRVLRMQNGKQTSISLMPGDVVFVPQSMF